MRIRMNLALAALGLATLAAGARAEDAAKIGGQLEVNYTYNFNKPSTGNNFFLFNSRDAEFTVNVGEISISKAASDKSAGYTLRLITGRIQEYFDAVYGTGHIYEAYGTTNEKFGAKTLKIDAGQFLSHVGYETPDVGSTQFMSRSFNYQFLQPFVHAGIRAGLDLDAKTRFTGVVVNRFDGVKDAGNKELAAGFQIARTISENSSLLINTHTSRENLGTVATPLNKPTSVANVVYTNKLNETLNLAFDGTLRTGKDTTNRSYNVSGFTGYLTKTLSSGNSVGLRGEYLSQSNATSGILPTSGAQNSKKPSLSSITASYEIKGAPGARTILEYRLDTSSHQVFAGSGTNTKKNQSTVSLAQIFKF